MPANDVATCPVNASYVSQSPPFLRRDAGELEWEDVALDWLLDRKYIGLFIFFREKRCYFGDIYGFFGSGGGSKTARIFVLR